MTRFTQAKGARCFPGIVPMVCDASDKPSSSGAREGVQGRLCFIKTQGAPSTFLGHPFKGFLRASLFCLVSQAANSSRLPCQILVSNIQFCWEFGARCVYSLIQRRDGEKLLPAGSSRVGSVLEERGAAPHCPAVSASWGTFNKPVRLLFLCSCLSEDRHLSGGCKRLDIAAVGVLFATWLIKRLPCKFVAIEFLLCSYFKWLQYC